MQVKITKQLIKGFSKDKNKREELAQSQDGAYLTNGVWLLAADRAVCEYAPTADQHPPCADLLKRLRSKEFRPVKRSSVEVNGLEVLVTPEGAIVVWAQPEYLDMLDAFDLYSSGDWTDPIQVWAGDELVGALMPCRAPKLCRAVFEALAEAAG